MHHLSVVLMKNKMMLLPKDDADTELFVIRCSCMAKIIFYRAVSDVKSPVFALASA